jgi:hypothetical protein
VTVIPNIIEQQIHWITVNRNTPDESLSLLSPTVNVSESQQNKANLRLKPLFWKEDMPIYRNRP